MPWQCATAPPHHRTPAIGGSGEVVRGGSADDGTDGIGVAASAAAVTVASALVAPRTPAYFFEPPPVASWLFVCMWQFK